MGWLIGYDEAWARDVGYGVPAICDHPDCGYVIDRGLSYVCGGQPYGGDNGCGLFFCGAHLYYARFGPLSSEPPMCQRCCDQEPPFQPTPDVAEWVQHKLTDLSWRRWRNENPGRVAAMRATQ